MRKITLIFLTLILMSLFVGCQNNETNKTKTSDSPSIDKTEEKVQKQVYKQNEEAFITDENGENIYSLTINSAKAIDVPADTVEYMPKGTKQVLVLTYTYKYIKEDKNLATLDISPMDLLVYDENGMAIEFIDLAAEYPFDSDVFLTEGINAGRSKQVYGAFSLKNDITTIQVDFNSDTLKNKLTFEIPVERQ
ncbi:hypothetical protein GTW56_21500 [Bacillus sp. EB93]|nr:hypothetical protein [Peribacillus frigoritolerans]